MKKWSSVLSLLVMCLLFASQSIFGAEEYSTEPPPSLGEQPIVQETDAAGVTRSIGYLLVNYFDYWSMDTPARGSSHGIVYSEQKPDGNGWTFAFNYAPKIELSDVETDVWGGWRRDATVDMERYEAEIGTYIPDASSVGATIGVKLFSINKDYFTIDRSPRKEESFYVGPYMGVSGNHPLGGEESPLSFFWTGQVMALYVTNSVSTSSGNPISDMETKTLGLGLNGTAGLALKLWEHGYIQAGYRIQGLGGFDSTSADSYQAWLFQVGLRF